MTVVESVDLIVAGAGLAGCSAALSAAQAGRQVLVLEKLAEPGGSSSISAGCFAFAGTDLQRTLGIEDSAELLYRDLRDVGKQENVAEVVKVYADEQLDTFHWLREAGVAFSPVIEASAGHSVPRVHTVDPKQLLEVLMRRCTEAGVEFRFGCSAQRLLRDHDAARVHAVRLDDGEVIATRVGVVLATGGFSQRRELVHRYAPQYDNALLTSGAGSTGDGLRMACALGADVRDMAYIKGTFGKHPTDTTNRLNCMAVYKGAIAVNQDGRRFVDESLSYKLLGDACMAQRGHLAFQILDQDILESGEDHVLILDLMRRHRQGLLVSAPSIAELAAKIAVSADELRDTLDRYNHGVDAGIDTDFGRRHLVHEYGKLRRIARAPFHAYPSTAVIFGTYCGLAVDARMRVLDVFGSAIPGLHAAGEVVGGLHGAAYMTGSALAKAAIFGRIAARNAIAG